MNIQYELEHNSAPNMNFGGLNNILHDNISENTIDYRSEDISFSQNLNNFCSKN